MNSYWNENKDTREYPKLKQNISADVAIIGGGLTGIQTAYYLANRGLKVVVLEKDKLCSGTSGGSTGKITSQHGLIYKYLKDLNGKEYAKKYYNANEEAKENIIKIINKEKIDCDLEMKNAYVFTEVEKEVQNIKQEIEYTKKLNIPSEFVNKIDLPIDIYGAIKFENQAQFDPVKYVYGLTKSIIKNGGEIYENSKVLETVEDDGRYNITTKEGMVRATHLVIATRYPIIRFPGYYFIKMYQSTSYAVLVDTNTDLEFDGYYINSETPVLSFRTVKSGDKNLLLAVGYDYKTGSEIVGNPFEYLKARIKKMYPEAKVLNTWTAEDCISLDKIPYIGDFSDIMDNCYVATGFNKWGITSSNIAAKIITDKILGNENEYEEIFESSRLGIIKNKDEVMNMLKEAGEGIVLQRIKGKPTPTCTHLGCKLSWNPLEEIWECSCHGSKFTKRGFVLEGPAVKDLEE
ncbi:MAG: FAD-dependent oxidoreductase [Clostridia bacterium]|nr:FAD-dependent oxidoreductase [Clostridia bacterium]